jgi:D-aminopeptidase
VPAAIFVGNGYGKLMGATQVEELGEIETPILLTSTLNAPRVADALLEWMMALPGNEEARSINPIVGETNDGLLNDIRGRHVGREDVFAALRSATSGPVEEGALGAGTGTVAFGYKGGIGTASRVAGAWTVGALVQANYGGRLTIAGVPIGEALIAAGPSGSPDGSIIIVLATDAPLDARNLRRLGARAMLGVGRTGSSMSNGSGDYAIAFSVAVENRIRPDQTLATTRMLSNEAMSPLFEAAVEATEEAIYNALLKATTMSGRGGRTVEALPVERVMEILRRHGIPRDQPRG